MKHLTYLPLLLTILLTAPARPDEPSDSRLHGKLRTLDDKDFFFRVPATKEDWLKRRQAVREQILVATGLWPHAGEDAAPARHSRQDRPRRLHHRKGLLRQLSRPLRQRQPLSAQSRQDRANCPASSARTATGRTAVSTTPSDKAVAEADRRRRRENDRRERRYPLQARCAQLARMGCVVFHYDMVGYADSTAITHRDGLHSMPTPSCACRASWACKPGTASARSISFLACPTSIRTRIGVTGASGGGTQTFILCAVDDRPTVAFPAVMVSTAMQGGCVCENCSYLRVGTGNIEFAGLFAPKPLGMTGAHDWTIDIETQGPAAN